MTDRDYEVVRSVYKYKYLTSSQIETLHFPSETTRNRSLRRCVGGGYLGEFKISNIAERLFRITKKGAEHVAAYHGAAVDDLQWRADSKKPSDHYFMRHFVACNDFRIALTRDAAHGPVKLRGFIPEYYGTKHRSGRVTKYLKDIAFDISDPREQIGHTPDAVFCLEKNGKSALFFLEIDRGTETLSNPAKGFLKMIRFYLAYLKAGGFKGYAEDFGIEPPAVFRTLIVTTSPVRLENMQKASLALPDSVHRGLRFLWCSTFEQVYQGSVLDPVWTSLMLSDTQKYRIA